MPVWLWVALFWLFLTLIYSAPLALLSPRPPEPVMRAQLTWQSIYYLAWAPLTLLIWRVTRGWQLERLGWPRFLALHTGFGLAVSLAHAVTVVMIAHLVLSITEPLAMLLTGYLRGRLHLQLLIYAAIVATGQAFGFYSRYRERQVAAARLEAQLASARLDTLRAQLQPHFLFNSLHSIASLARAGDNAGVVRLISGFSDLLRHLLDSEATHHSAREELDLVSRYLDIQRVRFGDRLRVTMDVTPEAATARVPLLIVQPLVENALRHGFASRIEPGHVRIQARTDGASLVIEVADDGAGLPDGWVFARHAGTGLTNVASRLEGEFGNRQSFTVEPAGGGGVRVGIRIPHVRA